MFPNDVSLDAAEHHVLIRQLKKVIARIFVSLRQRAKSAQGSKFVSQDSQKVQLAGGLNLELS